jgi:hypothetical protein
MKEIVINCPCQSHKEDKIHYRPDGSKKGIWATPKILMTVEAGVVGAISVQCSDITCRTYNKKHSNGKYNSWYRVEFDVLGGCSVTPIPIPEIFWELETVPVAIMEILC